MRLVTLLTATTLLILTFGISGCSSIGKAFGPTRVVTDTTCATMRPMRCSRQDTAETLRQCKAHNRVYDTLCKGGLR